MTDGTLALHMFTHDGNEYISSYLKAHRCWEPLLTEVVKELILKLKAKNQGQQTHTFIDVGANLGYYSLWVASFVGVAPVVAWEPIQENLQLLRMNVYFNNLTNQVAVVPYAAGWEGNQIRQYNVHDSNYGLCIGVPVMNSTKTQWVQERDLEQVMHELEAHQACGVSPAHRYIMKVDIEEQEVMLLRSFTQEMWDRMDVLIVEVAFRNGKAIEELLAPHFAVGINVGEMKERRCLEPNTNHLGALYPLSALLEMQPPAQCNLVVFKQRFVDTYFT